MGKKLLLFLHMSTTKRVQKCKSFVLFVQCIIGANTFPQYIYLSSTKYILLNTGFARIEAYDSSSVMNTYSITVLITSQTKLSLSRSAPKNDLFAELTDFF
jgi:hypothetical protein